MAIDIGGGGGCEKYDGTAELRRASLEEMQADFAPDEAAKAVADADAFTVVRTQIYTGEFVLR